MITEAHMGVKKRSSRGETIYAALSLLTEVHGILFNKTNTQRVRSISFLENDCENPQWNQLMTYVTHSFPGTRHFQAAQSKNPFADTQV